MLFSRLIGQETEYAIRFSPERRRPGNDAIYEALASAIGEQVRTEPGMFPERPQIFLQNGGAFHYEYLPYRADGGLIEGATPECRGPAQLLVYQRAQESLLLKSMARAEAILRAAGCPGRLGLLKNCKDAEGHVYGAQESFEVEAASGASLWLYRAGLVLLTPLLALTVAAGWGIVIGLAPVVIVAALLWTVAVVALPPRRRVWFEGLVTRNDRSFENRVGRWLYWLSYVITWPFIVSLSLLLRCLVFSRMRRELTAFLVSRAVLSGAGSIETDGRFVLSEKGSSIRRV
ncbi:MAG TPA: proteasome accessory factor PafA2 family protein, partial [Vicinamibacteria bacterium]|nr:proteasome accessory factor PafA2 family protein [Vicinamibacteria bacterium]